MKSKSGSIDYFLGILTLIAVSALLVSSGCSLFKRKPTPLEKDSGQDYSLILSYAGQQAGKAFGVLEGGYPTYAQDGHWAKTGDCNWSRGMYPGMLWLLSQSTVDPQLGEMARTWIEGLSELKTDGSSFGLGLVFYPTYVAAYQVTGNRNYRDVALAAAETLALRFTRAGFFPAFGEPGDTVLGRRLSIESMMDLDLLYWASEATGSKEYSRMASLHTLFTIRKMVSDDGKILHMADFNPRTGEIYGERTGELADNPQYGPKGYDPSTVWALGQAWAVYGFTTAYRHEGNTIFLNAARKVADYLVNHLPEDGIPYWDFELPTSAAKQKDTSAAALTAAALCKLARSCPTALDRERYHQAAYKIVKNLNINYFAKAGRDGVIDNGVYDFKHGLGVNGPTAWGDYFYIEAVLLLRDFKA
ncbi:MAG: hypothetical protein A2Z86_05525 [Candidatus Glassbacteria bacterium GWA2_58_10]|uniref:Glucuronyl hydrolase n=1 Tax=Candidatus Glassbacteria bacterium GWA2_58_10 TaxID=1817865 RepID=A0A1F5YDM5_9BACT|nr:MAG: hypothetical protein A2Z86_05525 [Candidatus Glassbacteria bacterium GWA2_58_10]